MAAANVPTMDLIASYRPADDTTAAAEQRTFTGEDQADLLEQARAATPEGHKLIHVQRADQ